MVKKKGRCERVSRIWGGKERSDNEPARDETLFASYVLASVREYIGYIDQRKMKQQEERI